MKWILLGLGGLLLAGCTLTPRDLDRVNDKIDSYQEKLDQSLDVIRSDREERGVPEDAHLGLTDWLLIGSGLLGANYLRDRKYVKKATIGG